MKVVYAGGGWDSDTGGGVLVAGLGRRLVMTNIIAGRDEIKEN